MLKTAGKVALGVATGAATLVVVARVTNVGRNTVHKIKDAMANRKAATA